MDSSDEEADRKGLRTRLGDRSGLDERAERGRERTSWGEEAKVGEEWARIIGGALSGEDCVRRWGRA